MENNVDMESIKFKKALLLCREEMYEGAYCIFLELASEGNVAGMRMMGWMCFSGIGTTKDAIEGIRWAKLASEAGDQKAQFALGRFLEKSESFSSSMEWYEKSFAQGYLPSNYRMSCLILRGKGVGKDQEKALKMLKYGAERGHLWSKRDYYRLEKMNKKGLNKLTALAMSICTIAQIAYIASFDEMSESLVYSFPIEFTLFFGKRSE